MLVILNPVRQLCDLYVCHRTSAFSRVEVWLTVSSVKEEDHVSEVDKGRHMRSLYCYLLTESRYIFNQKLLVCLCVHGHVFASLC